MVVGGFGDMFGRFLGSLLAVKKHLGEIFGLLEGKNPNRNPGC